MKIAVDAMGGDFAPREIVAGAVAAAEEYGLQIILVGTEKVVRKELSRLNYHGNNVSLLDAPDTINMGDGVMSLRRKSKSSIFLGAELVKKGEAQAFVSMGNTAAVTYISKRFWVASRNRKTGTGPLDSHFRGVSLLIDVGASANCQPQHLLQFAIMGKVFMETALNRKNPTVALMSIGEEKTKVMN